jgi:hypothetical protein
MSVGNIAQGGGDPRLSITGNEKEVQLIDEANGHTTSYPRSKLGIRDPNVKFEE